MSVPSPHAAVRKRPGIQRADRQSRIATVFFVVADQPLRKAVDPVRQVRLTESAQSGGIALGNGKARPSASTTTAALFAETSLAGAFMMHAFRYLPSTAVRAGRSSVLATAVTMAFLLAPVCEAQSWYWQAARPLPYPIYSVWQLDADNALASARGGVILKTADGGATWIAVDIGLPDEPNVAQVQFVDADHAVAVGGTGIVLDEGHPHGFIFHSSDGGFSWSSQLDEPNTFVSDIRFSSSDQGIAAGFYIDIDAGILAPMIWTTTDGGGTWSDQRFDNSGILLGMASVDALTSYAVGADLSLGGLLLRTTDGGLTWENMSVPVLASLTGVAFADAEHGIVIAADGEIATTLDGGATWTPRDSGTSLYLSAVTLSANGEAMVVGGDQSARNSGILLRSIDGGVSWSTQSFGQNLEDVHFIDDERGIVTGHDGEILLTDDGGATWNESPSMAPMPSIELLGVAFFDADKGIAVGQDGAILATTDRGNGWHVQRTGDTPTLNLRSVAAPGDNFAMAVGGSLASLEGSALVSTDGGVSWTDRTPQPETVLYGVACPSAGNCTAVGGCSAILHTTDGGVTWETQHGDPGCGNPEGLHSVQFISDEVATAVGLTIERTTNGGTDWIQQVSPGPFALGSVSFVDSNTGWAAGVDFQSDPTTGVVIHTGDGGATWTVQHDDFPERLTSIVFRDAQHGYTTGLLGIIYSTDDGGVTWTREASVVGALNGMTLLDDGSVRAVGVSDDAFSAILASGGAPFHINLHPNTIALCREASSDATAGTVAVEPTGSHGGEVALTLGSLPAGLQSALDSERVKAPGSASWSVHADESAIVGDYVLRLTATDGEHSGDADLRLHVADAPPTPALQAPADGQVGVATRPTLAWDVRAPVQLQLATDAQFANRIVDIQLDGDHYLADEPLVPGTSYFWRVRGNEGCSGAWSATFSFTTLDEIFADGFETQATVRAASATTHREAGGALRLPDVPRLRSGNAAARAAATRAARERSTAPTS